jgi:hypothetical protein
MHVTVTAADVTVTVPQTRTHEATVDSEAATVTLMTLPRGGATCQCKFQLEPGLLLAVDLWRLSEVLDREPWPPGH